MGAMKQQNVTCWLSMLATVIFTLSFAADRCPAQNPLPLGVLTTTPSQSYYNTIEELYRGEYRDAQREFVYELRGSIKIGVTGRWIDSICYHAMLGETFYQMGLPGQALEQFNLACAMYLQYPNWMLQVTFNDPRVDNSTIRRPIPWGRSNRQFTLGKFNRQMQIIQGEIFAAQRTLETGGVVRQAQFWQVDVIEVIRATALAIRRRNELLGPLAPEDATTKALVAALSRGAAPPNHWSNAWVDLQLGLAYLGQGKARQALPRLTQAERVMGRFDHPLTCITLLEQGRLAMEQGKAAEADQLLREASYSAFYYRDVGIIDEAFRLMTLNRVTSSLSAVNPMLEPAAAWCRRERLEHVFGQLNLAYAEELMQLGNWSAAAGAVKAAQARMRGANAGRLGNHAQYLAARVDFAQGGKKTGQLLDRALQRQQEISTRNFQLGMANRMFDSRQLRPRSAALVYLSLLDDPSDADWVFRPLETIAALKTPQGESFDRWITAAIGQKDQKLALEIADRAKRRHYHAMLTWGGKKLALRRIMESSDQELPKELLTQRNAIALRVPDYQGIRQKGREYRNQIDADWVPSIDDDAWRQLVRHWRSWEESLEVREDLLTHLAFDRVSVDLNFPPLANFKAIQQQLQPGQAVLVFHDSPQGMLGSLITSTASTSWDCGSTKRIGAQLSQFLRDLGNFDATHDLSTEELQSKDWLASGGVLYQTLLSGSSLDVAELDELIIVPDGLLWYVPFTALPVNFKGEPTPMISVAKVRVAPTLGLAVGNAQPWRHVQRTALSGLATIPGENEQTQQQNSQPLLSALDQRVEIPDPLPATAQIFSSLLDILVVLEEQELEPGDPLGWTPLPTGRASVGSSLQDWSRLPLDGPQRLIFPGLRTIAERGGKLPSRRKASGPPGDELFLASCELLASGAQTILLSRWRVGGKSTQEIIREFVQELPYTTATEAWQRSVEVTRELMLSPDEELRVKSGKNDQGLTADHPIFWSGYLLIDTGAPAPVDDQAAVANANPGGEKAP